MENSVSIKEQVQGIIDKRKERLTEIKKSYNYLTNISDIVDQLESTRNDMIDSDGNARPDSKYSTMLAASHELPSTIYHLNLSDCKEKIAVAQKKLQAYKQRSMRENVYLSVVGLARTGKSALLQAFSGLNNNVIPSFNAEDCTGTTSVIYNISEFPEGKIRADLSFKSKEDMLALVQSYLDKLYGKDNPKRYVVHNFADIQRLSTKSADSVHQTIIDTLPKNADTLLLKYLEKIADHYDDWVSLAGSSNISLSDEKEIITYVAQNNGNLIGDPAREEYYKYLAVATCRISCSFPGEDLGKIVLIDTIGLGDHAIGIADSMLRTVRDESDAVVMLIHPMNGAGGGVNATVKDQLYFPIRDACTGRNLEDWLFILINNVTAGQYAMQAVNTAHCESAKQTLKDVNWTTTPPSIVDAKNPDAAKKFLRDILTDLMERLDSVDEIFRKDADEAIKDVRKEYVLIADRIAMISKTALQNNTQTNALIQTWFNAMFDNTITPELNAFAKDWETKRNTPCSGLFDTTKDILDLMTEGELGNKQYIPSLNTLEAKLKSGNNYLDVWQYYTDSIRTQIKNDFLAANGALDKYIIDMKTEVADMLYNKLGFKKLSEKQDDQTSIAWLQAFSENRLAGYQHLQFAVNTLLNFDFSVKGFLTYEVREVLDCLNSATQHAPQVLSCQANGNINYSRTAINIYDELDRRVVTASHKLQAIIRDLCIKPNRALCAEVEDFVERLLKTPDIRQEWNVFFIEVAGIFWADKIAANQQTIAVNQDWNMLAQKVLALK